MCLWKWSVLLGPAQTPLTTGLTAPSQGSPLPGCWLTDFALCPPLEWTSPLSVSLFLSRVHAVVSLCNTHTVLTHLHAGALTGTTVKLPWSVLFLCVQLTAETYCLY